MSLSMKKTVSDITGKRITVLGAARSGLAAARLLSGLGADIFLSEIASRDQMLSAAKQIDETGIRSEFDGHTEKVFDADGMVVSPGVPYSSSTLNMAREKGIPIWSEIEVASWFCRSPIIAVTGSNGKSTTTALLGSIFRFANRSSIVAGNIGQPFSDYVMNSVPEGVAILEVSSFQLETIDRFHPKVAVFLNLTPDHLNRHGSMEEYGRLKSRIFENQISTDYLVCNGLDSKVMSLCSSAKSEKVVFGKYVNDRHCAFVDYGWIAVHRNDRKEPIIDIEEMNIHGEHNVSNALAAVLAARLMGTDLEAIKTGLRTYRPLPHRMEPVRQLDHVEYINDSKATNVDSVKYALESFSTPVILIAGGRDKDSDFHALRQPVKAHVRSAVLLGEAADKIEKAFAGICPLFRVDSLDSAVHKAREVAQPGDIVLLSPGCASFDMFENFEDRGDQFKAMVEQL